MQPRNLPVNLLIGVVVLLMPLGASAEEYTIDPTEVLFGDVEVDQSTSQIVTITSIADEDLIIFDIMIWDDSTGSFEITSELPTFPYAMQLNETLEFEVTFTPAFEADLEGSVLIVSNAIAPGDQGLMEVWMYGNGVGEEPPPPPTIELILEFFDAAVANGDLVGTGNGNSADNRLNAFRNKIEAAGDLISGGQIEEAVEQLLSVFYKCDGDRLPPDHVAGPAAAELNAMVLELWLSLNSA